MEPYCFIKGVTLSDAVVSFEGSFGDRAIGVKSTKATYHDEMSFLRFEDMINTYGYSLA